MHKDSEEQIGEDRSGAGMTIGVITFLVGVALLLVTFKLAYDLFTTPPSTVVASSSSDPAAIDIGRSGNNLATIVIRVLLLIVMGLMGSLIANRGVSMFTHSRTRRPPKSGGFKPDPKVSPSPSDKVAG